MSKPLISVLISAFGWRGPFIAVAIVAIVAALLVAAGVSLDQYGIDLASLANGGGANSGSRESSAPLARDSGARGDAPAHPDYAQWSDTSPNINLWHVFEGEINRSGKPVGYHSRPGGNDPVNARVVSVRDEPNRLGVYTARVAVRDGNQWREKNSSFFPDTLSRDEVVDVVLNAYRESDNPNAQPFEGPSGLGFRIQGYTSGRGGINTAFPIYVRNP